ncbi:MAG: (Fe-S)-binding protein [Anaeromyxobacter sp.]|nr:(Fe-S)-binding protein [Anaeromyxobacter sp.]MBL0278363.1 (Fe-S)-binding protein [Anaeromyxobacter sp.]
MNPLLTAALLLLGGAAFAVSAFVRLAPLLALRRVDRVSDPEARLGSLFRFGFGQRRLLDPEEWVPGLLHVALFAAFVVLGARTVTLFGMGFAEDFHLPGLAPGSALGEAYALVKDVVVYGAIVGAVGFLWRRLVTRPDRVTASTEGTIILGFILGLMLSELAFERAEALGALGLSPGGVEFFRQGGFWLHLVLILVFLNVLPHGKHFHIVTALPNVFFRRSPPLARLEKLDLESEGARFGSATVKDLSWKEGWDVYSCTECGRCQTHCPTYVTGKPLSHKEVNRTLRRHLGEVGPDLVALVRARDPAAREALAATLPPLSEVIPPETFWACTTCGWCETACPVLIENVPRLIDLRRQAVQVDSVFPDEAARIFKGIETQGNPWGIGSNKRTEWCEDLDLPRASSGAPFEYLFFVGCAGAFDDRQKKVSRAIVTILRAAGVSFAILGEEETCTGDAARRLGNEYLFQLQAAALTETLNGHGVKKILVQCPHCLNTIKNELPDFGGRFEVVHHAELIARLVADRRLTPGQAEGLSGTAVTFHDPCYLARWNGVVEPPRAALRSAGITPLEMERSGRQGFCCGAGGGRMWLEETLGTRINRNRVDEAVATLGEQGGVIATGCPFCLTMMKDGIADAGKEETVRAMDVAELVALGLPKVEAPRG